MGIEEFDVALHRVTGRDGSPAVVWHRVAPETAHTMLLGRLYGRVEPMVPDDPLLERLREALAQAGLVERMSAEEAPPDLRAAAAAGQAGEFFRYAVDEAVEQWAGELAEQAGARVPHAG